MSKQFKTVESQFIPPGILSGIEAFKENIMESIEAMTKKKAEWDIKHNTEVPLPIGLYVMYDDHSALITQLFPDNAEEKKALIMALKRQIALKTDMNNLTSTNYIFGAITSEVFLGSYKMTEDDKKLSPEELEAKYTKQFKEGKEEFNDKVTRILVQFEEIISGKSVYDSKLYSIIDPGIMVLDEPGSKSFTEALNTATTPAGILHSLFDYTEDQELDALGKMNMTTENFNVKSAITFVQDVLRK